MQLSEIVECLTDHQHLLTKDEKLALNDARRGVFYHSQATTLDAALDRLAEELSGG